MIILRWLMSLIFIIQMYVMMAVIGILFSPWALVSRRGARVATKLYAAWVVTSARLLCGLRTQVRGPVPQGECIIAAKHQSFFDIIALCHILPAAKFVMKRELMWTPFLGLYALRIGCVPVDRGKKGKAVQKMKADVARGADNPGQLVIYPQGTRVAPGAEEPYKPGTGLLYMQFKQPCVPAATNIGLFWPKRGILRHPGTAVIEFLPVIEPGMRLGAFMERIETEIEAASNRLMVEAGFDPARLPAPKTGA